MVRDPKIVRYVEELDLLIIADGGKVYHINGDVIAGMWKAYAEGHGIDYDICEGCERVDPETAEPIKHGRWINKLAVNKNTKEERNARECSLCGAAYFVYKEVDVVPNYCPNCGARMDGIDDGTN